LNRFRLPILSFLFLSSFVLEAQDLGELAGIVTDLQTGEPLIGATVIVEGTTLGSATNLDGFFQIKQIPAGSVSIRASYVGYKPQVRYNVNIKSVANADINFQMQEIVTSISDIIVRPDPFEKEKESPMSVQSLTTEEIVAYPGGNNDIAKVVQSFPGVSGSISGFRNDIVIRGGAPNEVVYFLDGIESPNINHFATQGSGGGPVSLLNVSFFDGVSLNTSAFSAQYDNALSGVLQFNQRRGNAREARHNLRVSASETAFTTEGPVAKGDKFEANTTYMISARRSYLQFLFKLIDLPFLPDYWDFQAKVTHRINKRNTVNFVGLGSLDDFQINVPDDISAEAQAQLDGLPIIKQKAKTLGLSWNHLFDKTKGSLRNSLSYSTIKNRFQQFSDNENMEGLFFDNKTQETYAKLRTELVNYLEQWKFSSGITLQGAAYTNKTEDVFSGFSFESDLSFVSYGIFGQASRSFLEGWLALSGGFRIDGNSLTESGSELFKRFSPRISASFQVNNANTLRVNVSAGRYFKLPTLTVLGFENQAGENVNKSVEYIQSDHYVAGIEYVPRPSTRVNLEFFQKEYDDYPVSLRDSVSLANLGGDFEVTGSEGVVSVGKGKTQGVELSIQQKLWKNWFAILPYTAFSSEFTGFDRDEFLPSAWDYQNLISFTGGVKLPRNWEIGLKVRHNGEAPFAPVNLEQTLAQYPSFVFDYSALGSVRLDPFTAVDMRVDKKWNFSKWSLDIYLDLQNLTAATQPQPPVFGLVRDENNQILEPRALTEITDLGEGALLPSFGIIVDF